MWNASPRFFREIQNSHRMLSRLDVVDTRGSILQSIGLDDGTFTQDWTATVHRSGSITLRDEDGSLMPATGSDLLSPFTALLRPVRGVQYADGSSELIPQGVFKISQLNAKEQITGSQGSYSGGGGLGGGSVAAGGGGRVARTARGTKRGTADLDLTLLDRSSQCQIPLDQTIGIAGGTPLPQAIEQLLSASVPTFTYSIPAYKSTVAAEVVTSATNAWTVAVALAESQGFDIIIDRLGVVRLVPMIGIPGQAGQAWSYVDGVNALFWNLNRQVSSDGYPSVVRVIGTNSAAPNIWAEAIDNNPMSATYVFGPYGRVVKTVKSARVTSTQQAQVMANGMLQRVLGPAETWTFEAIPNPCLDVGDTVLITRSTMNIYNQRMLVSKVDLPSRPDNSMAVTVVRSVFSDEQAALQIAGALYGLMPTAGSNTATTTGGNPTHP
jgi:hypothetical protein